MAHEDPTLQELIVRALTGRDAKARQLLDNAASSDPELRQFYAELNEVVNVLAGSTDWRNQAPSPSLSVKIWDAVSEKMQSAPPRFHTVLLEADLGRRRAVTRLILVILAGTLILGLLAWAVFKRREGDGRLKLSGKMVFQTNLKNNKIQDWQLAGEAAMETGSDGFRFGDGEAAGTLFLKKGFDAESAIAFEIDVNVPELDEKSNVVVFLAESEDAAQPLFHAGTRPAQALSIEISQAGMVLSDAEHALLHSSPRSHPGAFLYTLRLEHLGPRVRALINGDVFFDGLPSRQLRGKLFPGIRLMGPQKNLVRFNNARVER